VLLEPLNRTEAFFLRQLADAASICRDAGHPGVAMMGDFYHMHREETSDLGAFISAGSYLHHVHLASRTRKLPGQVYGPGEALPKAEALREAKAWLRGLKADEVRTFCEAYRLPLPSTLERGQAGRITPAEVPDYPLEHPYYWSAFILIGDPR
jgi:sugar phosphate isomerase/epimerase